MAKLTCPACNLERPAPKCPACSSDEKAVELSASGGGKASCGNCGLTQALPKHCGWDMTVV